jgi:hypothetical protein
MKNQENSVFELSVTPKHKSNVTPVTLKIARTSQTKLRVISKLQSLRLGAKGEHTQHWSKHLLAPDLVAGRHLEHGRSDKKAAARTRGGHGVAAAANQQLGAVGNCTCSSESSGNAVCMKNQPGITRQRSKILIELQKKSMKTPYLECAA